MKKWLVLLTLLVSSVFCFAEETKLTTVNREVKDNWGDRIQYTITYNEKYEGTSLTLKNFKTQYTSFILDPDYKSVSDVEHFTADKIDWYLGTFKESYKQIYNAGLYTAWTYSYCKIKITESNQSKHVIFVYVVEDKTDYFFIFEVE